MIEKWEKISTKLLGNYKIFSLTENQCISPRNGKKFPFLVLNTNDWINVIPVTNDRNIVLVKQYRHGNEEITFEIPGGMVDNTDDSPMEAAKRELLEETGYASNEFIELGVCSPNPAIFDNNLHIFLALNAKLVNEQEQDGAEDIEVLKVSIDEFSEYIKSGKINHALVVAAFHLFKESEYFLKKKITNYK